jgi:ParB-like chromosome segregation protein Spo0J
MDIQLPLIKTKVNNKKLVRVLLSDLPSNDKLDLPKGQPTAEFVQDIINRGLLEPIVVIKIGKEYLIESGNKRVAAMRKIQELIPDTDEYNAIWAIVKSDATEVSMMSSVASNHMRQDNVITDMRVIRHLIDKYPNMDEKQMATALGMSIQTLRRRKKLLRVSDVIMDSLIAGKISTGVAEALAGEGKDVQNQAIAQIIEKGKVSLEDIKVFQRERKQTNVDALAPTLFPILPELTEETVDTEQISDGLVLLGVALMDENGVFLSPCLANDDPDTQIEFTRISSEHPGSASIQEVYIYNK